MYWVNKVPNTLTFGAYSLRELGDSKASVCANAPYLAWNLPGHGSFGGGVFVMEAASAAGSSRQLVV